MIMYRPTDPHLKSFYDSTFGYQGFTSGVDEEDDSVLVKIKREKEREKERERGREALAGKDKAVTNDTQLDRIF